jgi:[lysine-biosynthesis-protein LysW]--L-2-aminoadipate ligase
VNDLRIGILLSHVREEEKRLFTAFSKRGVEPIRLHDRRLTFEITALDRPQPQPLDVVLDRCMAHSRANVSLEVFEALGVATVNSSHSAATADDKVATSLALAKAGVPSLRTFVAFDNESALEVLETLGYPAVLKPVTGSWGRLLSKVNSPVAARALLEHKKALGSYHHAMYYIQEYVDKPGRDLRILVVGDDVMGASYRSADHWVTNVARGAVSTPCEVTPEIYDLSLRATRAIGAEIAGVDLVETPDGLKVIEVNTGAEFKGLSRTTETDIPGAIADHLIKRANEERQRAEAGMGQPVPLNGLAR